MRKGSERNAQALLRELGFKVTRSNVSLINGLVQKSIPFDGKDIASAIKLLDKAKDKRETAQLLQQIISKKFPVNYSVLKAFQSLQTTNLSEQMQSMLTAVKYESSENSMIRMLEGFHTRPKNQYELLTAELMKQAKSNNRQLFSLLQLTGVIDSKTDFSRWKSAWNNVPAGDSELPYTLNLSSALQGLEQIIQHKSDLSAMAKEMLQLWGAKLSETTAGNLNLTKAEFDRLKQQMVRMLPINTQQYSFFHRMDNNSTDLERLYHILNALSNRSTYITLSNQVMSGNNFLQASSKEQFLLHLKHWLRASGMDYENQLLNNRTADETSLKGLLLQLVYSGGGKVQEKAGQFLHYIHGLQLHSVQESNGFLHINLQIPGEKMGLLNDIHLEFEGKKTETGEINPEHCRILFHLHLQHLQETLVDMHIQKRNVAVTVFTDIDRPGDIFGNLKHGLKKGLENLNYQLSSVQYRKLNKGNHQEKKMSLVQPATKGVDYRI